ncbi:MAG: NAD-dependent epimerase/dehydratase family protein [Cyclonatronaceae bacterium]
MTPKDFQSAFRHPVIRQDVQDLAAASIPWRRLENKCILVTGATGMLASYVVYLLMYLNEIEDLGIRILLLARNPDKLVRLFGEESDSLVFLVQDVCDEIAYSGKVHYIIHAAGPASPFHILNNPVDIIRANTLGTLNVLELARRCGTDKLVFMSTREVYGTAEDREVLRESDMGVVDPLDPRSCYPESKRAAETMMKSYSIQHGIDFNSLRIAHVYGPGMQLENDGRVMSDLLNDAVKDRDIVLKSVGAAERSFCYITDAVDAIYRVLLTGKINEAYNIANEKETVSILELAKTIQLVTANNKGVKAGEDEAPQPGYCTYKRTRLETSKVEHLGWKPRVSLEHGISRTIKYVKNSQS